MGGNKDPRFIAGGRAWNFMGGPFAVRFIKRAPNLETQVFRRIKHGEFFRGIGFKNKWNWPQAASRTLGFTIGGGKGSVGIHVA